ncbi:hypothetical protein Vau01_055560 [Virgisporangium aurantiacum]|uniref:Uncharacterized protein n=1 Tax=Virgisporangium aurantiacum TaxID=175570 RepID=A0A8J3ZAH6_9ACTN|nr:hypothetical protein Vau01_055560 [Virgisporangium aurantiacum]
MERTGVASLRESLADPAERSRDNERLRATLRTLGVLWRLEVTAAGRQIFVGLVEHATTASEVRRVHDLAEGALSRRFRTVSVGHWYRIGNVWTAELRA